MIIMINDVCNQVISGISINTYNSDVSLYADTLKMSIAACMTGVSSANVVNLIVTGVSSSSSSGNFHILSLRRHSDAFTPLASSQINAAYDISVTNSAGTYSSLSSELQSAVADGNFNDYLNTYSTQTGATGFQGATSSSVETTDIDDDSDNKKLTPGVIAGIVIGIIAVCLLIGAGAYYFFRGSQSNQRDPTVAVAVELDRSSAVSYEKSKNPSAPSSSAAVAATLNPIAASNT